MGGVLEGVVEVKVEVEEAFMSSPRALERSWAFFSVSMLETHQRLGILPRFLQWSVFVVVSCCCGGGGRKGE